MNWQISFGLDVLLQHLSDVHEWRLTKFLVKNIVEFDHRNLSTHIVSAEDSKGDRAINAFSNGTKSSFFQHRDRASSRTAEYSILPNSSRSSRKESKKISMDPTRIHRPGTRKKHTGD
jgi:hypothetical protein